MTERADRHVELSVIEKREDVERPARPEIELHEGRRGGDGGYERRRQNGGTIVLAVGTVRGWRSALLGTAGGLGILAALVVVLGPTLGIVPLNVLQLVIGVLLLLFGLSWLRKAILRAAGVMPKHDEIRAFATTTAALTATTAEAWRQWDPVAILTTLKAVVLEGIEVVFIVLSVGAADRMIGPASLGAVVAGVIVALAALLLADPSPASRRPR